MMCAGAVVLVLLALFSPSSGVEVGNLQQIISFLKTTYGFDSQFALAINVPAERCALNFNVDQNFLQEEIEPQQVKNQMNNQDRIYKGKQLIGAKPKPIPRGKGNYHSEYLLLLHSQSPRFAAYDPLMQNLLNSNQQGCTVFYTYNSPCVNTCSTPRGIYSIISPLNMFRAHGGPKAFVFNQVWKHDMGRAEWKNNIKLINDKVPVYRCDANGCTRCVDQNNAVHRRCQ